MSAPGVGVLNQGMNNKKRHLLDIGGEGGLDEQDGGNQKNATTGIRTVHCEDFSNEVCPRALVGYFLSQGKKFHFSTRL